MKKKILIIIISILCLGGIIFTFTKVKADSGWDSSYDSDWGCSSWSSDSNWSSSDWDSSWDNDWSSSDSHSSYHSGSYNDGDIGPEFVAFLFSLVVIAIIIFMMASLRKKIPTVNEPIEFHDTSDEILAKYGINKAEFKQMIYQKYVDIQNAWMNFDYDKLKENLTNELYNSYKMQLEALNLKKQKNIMSDFEFIDAKIIRVFDENNVIDVKTYLRVCMYDYVVDEKNQVLRGTKNQKIDIQYIIDFVKEKNTNMITKCPNCGAEIKNTTNDTCEYCRAKIILTPTNYVMSRKMSIGQRRK